MITINNETYFYYKFESIEEVSTKSIFSSIDLSIVFDLLSIDTVNESFLVCIEEINKHMISIGLCMVLVYKDTRSTLKLESLNIVPSIIEAEDYLQMEQIQRDLGV
jgi:hypothetical protein